MSYLIPIVLISTFTISVIKKINLFDSLVEGISEAVKLTIQLIPYLCAVFIAIELLRVSGASELIAKVVSPIFTYLGIPKELLELIILRPLSGSGSLALLENIYLEYGADSFIGVTASIIMGSTETIFYVISVYFSTQEDKKTGLAIPIALFSSFIGTLVACALARLIV